MKLSTSPLKFHRRALGLWKFDQSPKKRVSKARFFVGGDNNPIRFDRQRHAKRAAQGIDGSDLPGRPGEELTQVGGNAMAWRVENPSAVLVEQAYALYNKVKATDLPAAVGTWGIDSNVWGLLITLTQSKCKELKIPLSDPKNSVKGWCIWASVVATKFYVLKFAYIDSHVVRVTETSDHYFVAVQTNNQTGICDITCNQFGGPDYITGSLKDVKGTAQRVKDHGLSLYDAYALGAKSNTFVI